MQLPGEFFPFIEKKVGFCLVVGGVTPPYTLSGPTTKKTLFYVCLPLRRMLSVMKISRPCTCKQMVYNFIDFTQGVYKKDGEDS